MSYATTEDMEKRYGQKELVQLTDRENVGRLDESVLSEALADASAECDSYMAGRVVLPLTFVPPVLLRAVCDIARFRLYGVRAPEEIRNRYKDAVSWLRDVASGKAVVQGAPVPSAPRSGINVAAPGEVFTADVLGRFGKL